MQVHIIGAGPVGLLVATLIQESGHQPLLVTRDAGNATHRSFDRLSPSGAATPFQIPLTDWSRILPDSVAFAVICTKAGDALGAFNQLDRVLVAQSKVLFLNNGMGPQQSAYDKQPERVLWGANTHGAYFDAGARLVHTGWGSIDIGQPEHKSAPQDFPSCFYWNDDINTVLWRKLAVNALINPLAAKFRCQNGDLITHAEARPLMTLLAQELDRLALAAEVPDLGSEAVALEVAQRTASNWSSTVQDLMQGRPNELPFITGYIVALAASLGVACPTHKSLLSELVGGLKTPDAN